MSTVFEAAARLQSAGIAEELLVVVLRTTVLLLLARVLLAALPRASGGARYLIATGALVAALLIPLITAVVPSMQVADGGSVSRQIGVSDSEENSLRTAISLARATGVLPERPLTAFDRATELVTSSWKGWIVLAVVTPSALLLIQMLVGAIRGRQAGATTAPTGFVATVNRVAVALYWFNPLAWSLEKQAKEGAERAKDGRMTEPSQSRPVVFGRRGLIVASVLMILVITPLAAYRLVASDRDERGRASQAASAGSRASGTTIDVQPDFDVLGDLVAVGIAKAAGRDPLSVTPTDGDDWYERGWRLYRSDRYGEAAAAFSKAAEMDYRRDVSLYNAACSHSLNGNSEAAIRTLDAALRSGWDDLERIGTDRDLDPLRGNVQFAQLVQNEKVATGRLTRTLRRYEHLRESGAVTRAGHKHADDWLEVGVDLLSLRRYDEAIHAFQQAHAAEYKPSTAAYNIACAEALRGNTESGLAWVDRAIENGYSNEEKLRNDPDLTLLRRDPRFEALVVKANELEMRGCCDSHLMRLLAFAPDWKSAADHHRRIAAKYPNSGRAWFNLGYTALQARDFDAARRAYLRTIELEYRVGTSAYNIACAHALEGDSNAAFTWLERAREAGFDLSRYLDDDEDLRSLRRDARWKKLTREVKREKNGRSRVAAFCLRPELHGVA